MKEVGGNPAVGPSARCLGVRPGVDVPEQRPDEVVTPGRHKGMSVAPGDPTFLPRHRRPRQLGGLGRDPIWEIDSSDLNPDLQFVQDDPTHGVIEPSRDMTLADFKRALQGTRLKWTKV